VEVDCPTGTYNRNRHFRANAGGSLLRGVFYCVPKSQRFDAGRFAATENVEEYLEFRPPESVIKDMADDACSDIEGRVVESLPQEQQHQWVLRPAYTLTPIEFEELHALWFRGRVEQPLIRELAGITHSEELKQELNRILALPRLKFEEEKPGSPSL
jgi:hypothetical protein